MANGMMFVCANARCGTMADTPRGWLTIDDSRGGTIVDPTSARWRVCSWKCLREWAATFEPVDDAPLDQRRRIRGPQNLVGADRDRE